MPLNIKIIWASFVSLREVNIQRFVWLLQELCSDGRKKRGIRLRLGVRNAVEGRNYKSAYILPFRCGFPLCWRETRRNYDRVRRRIKGGPCSRLMSCKNAIYHTVAPCCTLAWKRSDTQTPQPRYVGLLPSRYTLLNMHPIGSYAICKFLELIKITWCKSITHI